MFLEAKWGFLVKGGPKLASFGHSSDDNFEYTLLVLA